MKKLRVSEYSFWKETQMFTRFTTAIEYTIEREREKKETKKE